MPTVQTILDMKGTHVFSIPKDQTVLTAAHTMNQHRVGALVVNRAEKVIGIFTERDVLCRVVGIVSIGDVLAALEAVQGQTIRYLYEYMYGAWGT
jgi:CBS domain-containing protein